MDQSAHIPLRSAVWGAIPPRNDTFTGRSRLLDAVRDRLAVTLLGRGGAGKSQIAIEFAYRHAADYDLVWWIPAEGRTQVQAALVELALRLGLQVEPSAHAAVPAVLDALRSGEPYRNWLLVFDNADRPEDVRPFLPHGPGHVLVTSRDAQWASVTEPVEVDVFTRSESVDLLQRRNRELTPGEANRLADALQDLPLMVGQAAAWLAETGMTVDDCLAQDAVVSSMNRLRTENEGACDLLRMCAFLAPEPIPRTALLNAPELPEFPQLAETLRDPVLLAGAFTDISRYGLATVDHRNDTLQLNRLVQQALRPGGNDLRHAAHLLLAGADPNHDNIEAWRTYAQLVPHVIACAAADCTDPRVRRLAINVVAFLIRWGAPDTARDVATELVTRWRDTLGEDHRDTLVAARWIGVALRRLGRFDEARQVGERTLLLMRVHLGDDDPDTLAAADNHAVSLRLSGNPAAARELDEDTVHRKADALPTLDNLAVDLLECGRCAEAREMQELTVRRLREHIGARHPMTLAATKNLAVARRRSGDPAAALPLAQFAFDGFVARYGPAHPDAMAALMCLAVTLRQLGRREEARQLGLRAHALYEQAWGDDHPFTAAAATNLAVTLGSLGELSEARYLNRKALRRMRAALGDDHPFTLCCAVNLANDLARSGQYADARDLNLATLARARRTLSADHPTTLAAATNLALDLRSLGQHDESADLQRDTVERLTHSLGAGHPATISAVHNHRAVSDIDAPQI